MHNEPQGEEPNEYDYDADDAAAYNADYEAWANWEPERREGYGPMVIMNGVSIIGQEGVVLAGSAASMEVRSQSASFVSLDVPHGLTIKGDSSTSI